MRGSHENIGCNGSEGWDDSEISGAADGPTDENDENGEKRGGRGDEKEKDVLLYGVASN